MKRREKVKKFKKIDENYNRAMKALNDADKALVDEVKRILASKPQKGSQEEKEKKAVVEILDDAGLIKKLKKKNSIEENIILLKTEKNTNGKTPRDKVGKFSLAQVLLAGTESEGKEKQTIDAPKSLKDKAIKKEDAHRQRKLLRKKFESLTTISFDPVLPSQKSKIKKVLHTTGVWRDKVQTKNRIENEAKAEFLPHKIKTPVEREPAFRASRS